MLATMGPGLMVCLADTDGPCLVTAAQSGADWGYDLLSLQLVLIPVLFIAQELTIRLGVLRGAGIVGILKNDVRALWAWLVALPLFASCLFGLISEYTMIGQAMLWWNVPLWLTNLVVTVVLVVLALTGSYAVAEKIGLVMGACQIILFGTMFASRPDGEAVAKGLITFPMGQSSFVKLVTANIGAVIMPWMLAYQQSAICHKKVDQHGGSSLDDDAEGRAEHLWLERIDTAVGSFLTQGVMAAMLITVAAVNPPGGEVNTVNDILHLFTKLLRSELAAKWLLTFAIVGACMVAAIVQTLCGGWAFEEVIAGAGAVASTSASHGVVANFRRRPVFFGVYVVSCLGASIFTLLVGNAVDLSVWTEFLNGILMPPIVFALWYMASYGLPPQERMGPVYKWFTFVIFFICSAFCVGSIFFSFGG